MYEGVAAHMHAVLYTYKQMTRRRRECARLLLDAPRESARPSAPTDDVAARVLVHHGVARARGRRRARSVVAFRVLPGDASSARAAGACQGGDAVQRSHCLDRRLARSEIRDGGGHHAREPGAAYEV